MLDFEKYTNDFTWDTYLKFPIPTVSFVMRRTGQDVFRFFDTEGEALGNLVAMTRSAKNYLFSNRTDLKAWEQLLQRDIELVYNVLEYILEFINFALFTGDYEELFKKGDEKAIGLGLKNAKLMLVSGRKVLPFGV